MGTNTSDDDPIIRSDDFSRWTPPSMGGGGEKRPMDISPKNVRMPTAGDLEALRQVARAEGLAEGREQGYREGLRNGAKEIQDKLALFEQLFEALEHPLQELDEEVEDALTQLAIVMVRQMFRREIQLDPSQIVGVVREALAVLPVNSRHVSLHLHPDDAKMVQEAYSYAGNETNWRIEEDPSLTRGGCRVVTDSSRVDASVESRLAALIAPLMGTDRGQKTGGEQEDSRS